MVLEQTNNKKLFNTKYFYTVVFLFYLYLAYNTPLTGDDWTWGTNKGIIRMENGFAGYNGRYISNLLEILLTRYDWVRYITLASFSTILIYLVGKLYKQRYISLFSFIFFLLIPTTIFSQTFGWTAGFVNYIPSLVFLLFYLVIVKNIFNESSPSYNNWLLLLIIPLGIITQLVVEHVSMFALYTAVCVIIYTYLRHKKFYTLHIAYLVSVIIGSIIMFSNKAYWNVLNGTDPYRSAGYEATENVSLIRRIFDVYSDEMYKYLFLDNLVVNLFLGIMVIILIATFVSGSKWINFVIKPILSTIIIGFLLYIMVFENVLGDTFFYTKTNEFEALFSILYFISIVVSITIFIKNLNCKLRLFYYLSGVVLLSAPFVFITPYGPRCALASFVFLVLVSLELYAYNTTLLKWPTRSFIKPLLAVGLSLVIAYTFIFTVIGVTKRERLSYLKEEVNTSPDTIYLSELPYSQFLWMASTKRKRFVTMFKRFYDVPESIEIKFVPYNEWKTR